ncbi:E3 ubiquitin-protein ligase rififylin [Trichomycterus rosablanca]|uniref:E3 ubiquitin-protein ligase rififylin n=1 Tax=Trichomycterus rosablanca TaxID=2290929 RepID=UPI002F350308
MLASCCNWLCLDLSTVEESSTTRSSSRHQAYTNSGYNSYPSPPERMCTACGCHFNTLDTRYLCVDCRKNYCERCSAQVEAHPRMCLTCLRFHGTMFERAELMKLKVKDLRDYLHLHEVPTQMCREKEELVELVLSQQTPTPTSSASTPSEMHAHTHLSEQDGSSAPTPVIEQPPTLSPVTDMDLDVPTAEDDQSSDSEEALPSGRRASLSDLTSVEDIEALSVRQLKEILARNFVNYKGCCEKWELMERVTRLYHDQKDLHNLVSNAEDGTDPTAAANMEENLCKICMDSPIDCVLLECGHMVTCTKCGKRMSECPICRQYVVRAVHIFRS